MAEPRQPESIEEIRSMLGELSRRMAELERQVAQVFLARPVGARAPVSAPRRPVAPPPRPPEAQRPIGAPAGPAPAAEPPARAEEPIPLELSTAAMSGLPLPAAAAPIEQVLGTAAAPGQAPVPQWAVTRPRGKPAQPIEQVLGTKWLLIAGVALLLLGGGFFFQYALAKGWITPPTRCISGTILALVVIGLGEWAFRRGMKLFAAGLFAVGVVWLYYTCWAASPNGPYYPDYEMISRPVAFGLMCVVTLTAVGLSIRANMLTGGVIALVGAFATPALLASGRDEQVALMSYLLVVNAGFLALAYLKRWEALAPVAIGGTALLFLGWFLRFYHTGAWVRTSAFAWSLFVLIGAYAVTATFLRRAHQYMGIALTAAAGGLLALLWVGMDLTDPEFFGHLLALEAIVLAICLLRRWNWLRFGLLGWTVAAADWQWQTRHGTGAVATGPVGLAWSVWIWVLFALLTADVLVRTYVRRFRTDEAVDTTVATLAMCAMFGATYRLLDGAYHAWMGLYTACLGAAALAAAWAISRLKDRRVLAYAFLAQGLVLIVLAVPIEFERATVTIAWAVLGTAAMLLARRLQHVPSRRLHSRILAIKCAGVLGLALIHFVGADLPTDPRMGEALVSLSGVTITNGLALAAGLTAALLAATALLRAGPPIVNADIDALLAGLMLAAGLLLFAVRTVWELPAVTSTWWWLVMAGGTVAVGLWRRSAWLSAVAAGVLLGAGIKWVVHDTLARRIVLGADVGRTLVANWQFAAGLAGMVVMLIHGRLLRTRQIRLRLNDDDLIPPLCATLSIFGVLLIVWGGSFEVDRYFARHGGRFEDPFLATHMALSLWWALYAAALLTIGFARGAPALRYVAIVLFAVTFGKVFLVDMRGVEAVYRILSFLGLGALLVAASWLYHRFFRSAPAAAAGPQRTDGDAGPPEGPEG